MPSHPPLYSPRWVDLKAGEIHSYVRVRGPLTGWPGGAPSGGYDMMAREGFWRSAMAVTNAVSGYLSIVYPYVTGSSLI
jgi:hypothetical protein